MAELTALYTGAGFKVSDYRCTCGKSGAAAPETSSTTDIVFVRRGVFCRHIEGRDEVSDINHLLYFQADQEYRISHPTDLGDDCTVLTFTPDLTDQALSEFASDPSLTEARPFSESSRCLSAGLYHRHWRLLRLITARAPALEVDEAAWGILEEVISARNDTPPIRARAGTVNAHRDLANEAKIAMNAAAPEMTTLDGLSATLSTSPFHLSRVFRQQTGMGLADYAVQLRVHIAVDRLTRTRETVGSIAATLGFSSPSYFVYRFRQTTGMTPLQYRASASVRPRTAPKN